MGSEMCIRDSNDNVVGTLNLDMHGVESIYQKRWKDVIEQKFSHKITINVRLSMADLVNIRRWNRTVKRIYTNHGTVLGVVMSVNAQFVSDIWHNEVVCAVEFGIMR